MGVLKILPGNIANMIAAGEVVQRPASVVKELVENAIDAGATSISVSVTDSGRTTIQVIDNGAGMSPQDALLCFERHATSKIAAAEDLEKILTYGFRGEALASIAAVSEVTLKTRRSKDELATVVSISDGRSTTSQASAPAGSSFTVRNLFYNVPARRKFLKSDNVELKHVVEEFTRVALVRPDVAMTLISNGRELYVLKPAKSRKFRIMDLLGSGVVGDIVDISASTSVVEVSGYVGRPDSAKKTLGNQFFFVNGRFFRSPYLHKAVMKAYEDFVPEGATPSYILFLEVNPQSVDVNISPTKTEIKFEDDSVIFQTLFACVRETLGKNSFGTGIDFDMEGAAQIPVIGKNSDQYRQIEMPQASFDPQYNPFEASTRQIDRNYSPFTDKSVNYGALFEEKTLPSTQVLVLQGRFIVTPAKSGLMVVNIARARERVLYERFLRAISGTSPVSQRSLFPVQVEVGIENRLLFDGNESLLRELGFDITPFGKDTVVVNGVPEGFPSESEKVRSMVFDLLGALAEGIPSLKETMESTLASRFASIGAAGSETAMSAFEAQKLIDTLLSCENAEYTPRGKQIITIINGEELEKRLQ